MFTVVLKSLKLIDLLKKLNYIYETILSYCLKLKKKKNTKSKNPTYGKDKQTKTNFLTKFALYDSKKCI